VNKINNSTQPANYNPTIGQIGYVYSGYTKIDLCEFLVYTQYHNDAYKNILLNWIDANYQVNVLPVPGAALWLDASQQNTLFTDAGVTPVKTSSGAIYQWSDLSGNNRHAIQVTSGNRPTWLSPSNGRNGYGIMSFNGSSQYFAATMPAFADGYTVYCVFKHSGGASESIYGLNPGTNNIAMITPYLQTTSFGVSQWGQAVTGTSTATAGTVYGCVIKYDGSHTTGNFLVRASNATADVTGTMTQNLYTPAAGTANIGRLPNATQYFSATLMEFIIFSSQRSTADDTAMKNYLANKWGITWS
jgi:hypothetical protein